MKVDAISYRDAAEMPRIYARIEDALGRMEPLADETGQPVDFAPTEDEARQAMMTRSLPDLDRRVTADVERAQRNMVRLRARFPVS